MNARSDTIEVSMSLAAALATSDIATALGCDTTTALEKLLASDTGAMLYDNSLKLWWESPREIAMAYLQEAGARIPDSWEA